MLLLETAVYPPGAQSAVHLPLWRVRPHPLPCGWFSLLMWLDLTTLGICAGWWMRGWAGGVQEMVWLAVAMRAVLDI